MDEAAPVQARPPALSAGLIVVTVLAGLAVRFVHLGLPAWIVKFGGSALWAVGIYFLCSTLLGTWRPAWNAALSGIIGTAIEFLKLYQAPWLDAIRVTVPGILILGRIFNWRDIVVYWVAIMVAAAFDHGLRRSLRLRQQ